MLVTSIDRKGVGRRDNRTTTGHLTRLVDDLLDIARVTNQKLQFRPDRVELRSVVRRAVEVINLRSMAPGIVCSSSPPLNDSRERRCRSADPVFVNLLNNAAKYTPSGGQIGITVAREGNHAIVATATTGSAFRPKRKQRSSISLPKLGRRWNTHRRRPRNRVGAGQTSGGIARWDRDAPQ